MKASCKIISALLVLVMLFTFAACNGAEETQTTAASTTAGTSASTSGTTATSGSTSNNGTSNNGTSNNGTSNENATNKPQYLIPEDIKNLIIIIGDGMGPQHIEAGQIIQNTTYCFTNWNDSVCNTNSINSSGSEVLTDSAASATALATGTLTKNGYVGKDKNGNDMETILDIAVEHGKAVGVVTTDYLHGATPGGFSGHSTNRNNSDEITVSQISSDVNFLCGLRQDSHYAGYAGTMNLFGTYYATDLNDKEAILDSEYVFLPIDIENGATNEVELKDAASLAIEYLERDTDGFVLMIEQAYIDKYSHNNKIDGMLDRMESLNETVEMVMEWIGDRTDTAVIITADHETGGLSVSKTNTLSSSYSKNGNTVYYSWSSGDHTQTEVRIFTYGVTFDYADISKYHTTDRIKNTDVFKLMKEILHFD